MGREPGRCISCDESGSVGEACQTRVCSKRGYRHIPIPQYEKLSAQGPSSADPLIGLSIDSYLVVDVIGAGGFGKVYLTLQQPVQMRTALKLLKVAGVDPKQAKVASKKFIVEAQALAALSHPNIVRFVDFGSFRGSHYLVMEFVDGAKTVNDLLARSVVDGRGLEPATILHIVKQLLHGLEAAHRKDIVHRDIKPDNILLQPVNEDPYFVRLVDFGIAKFVTDTSGSSHIIGTPSYMAPEQMLMRGIGPWTDLYAVGVLTFELVTGRRPFPGDSFLDIVALKRDPDYDPITQVGDLKMSKHAKTFFRRAMAVSTQERYRNTDQFSRALEVVLDDLLDVGAQTMALGGHEGLIPDSELMELRQERRRIEGELARLANEQQDLEVLREEIEERQRLPPQDEEPAKTVLLDVESPSHPLNIPKPHDASEGDEKTISVDDFLDSQETLNVDLSELDLTHLLDD